VRLDLAAQAGQSGQHRPVRLRARAGHQAITALPECVGEDVLKTAQLVAAKTPAGQVIPFKQHWHA
jgi:hypothetical protein